MLNVCPVCRNVNQPDATACRYCGTGLVPPAPPTTSEPRARRRWPWVLGGLALLLIAGFAGITLLFTGGGASAAQSMSLVVGTDTGTALQFEPKSVQAPANTPVKLTFENRAQVPHNLTFQSGVDAKTAGQVPAGQQETISFTTPAAGTYKFDCTIHPGMEGQLVVK